VKAGGKNMIWHSITIWRPDVLAKSKTVLYVRSTNFK